MNRLQQPVAGRVAGVEAALHDDRDQIDRAQHDHIGAGGLRRARHHRKLRQRDRARLAIAEERELRRMGDE